MNILKVNGQYECEGHSVTFLVSLDNTCINCCLLYTSAAAGATPCVDLGGRGRV